MKSVGVVLMAVLLLHGVAHGAKPERSAVPELKIPVTPLGYVEPNRIPAFYYRDLVELHFIDATHLLFAFDVKKLLQRDGGCSVGETERAVRVAVLELPGGKVVRQADWELYDWNDFLWGLGDGEFLLRRCTQLETFDSSLQLHPLMQAPGKIEAVEFSQDRSLMAIENDTGAKPVTSAVVAGMIGARTPQVNVAFVAMHPPMVVGRALLPAPGVLPMVDRGILESLEGRQESWDIIWTPLAGKAKSQPVGTVRSYCTPELTPLGDGVVAAALCGKDGELEYAGLDWSPAPTQARKRGLNGAPSSSLQLWRIPLDANRHMPRLVRTRNGARFAIEAVHGTRHLAALDPLTSETTDGETVDVYDTKTGARVGGLRVTPVYTAGRNVAFSPDGDRLAVLRDGAIEVYRVDTMR